MQGMLYRYVLACCCLRLHRAEDTAAAADVSAACGRQGSVSF